MLTKLEDQIVMTVWKFRGKAYGVNVYDRLLELTGQKLAVGVIYANLDRLTRKGYLRSYMGEPTAVRGGMRKTYYKITPEGMNALAESKRIQDRIWDEYPGLAVSGGGEG